jgi:hypothetical protein
MNVLDIPEVQNVFTLVIDPIVRLLFAAAMVYFAYGVFKYVKDSGDSDARATGGKHILWSTVGLFIMISVWGIIAVLERTIGVQ